MFFSAWSESGFMLSMRRIRPLRTSGGRCAMTFAAQDGFTLDRIKAAVAKYAESFGEEPAARLEAYARRQVLTDRGTMAPSRALSRT